MSKQEIYAALIADHSLETNRRSPTWERAFDLFNQAPENKGNRVSMSCGSCFSQVRNWLKRG